MISDQKEKVARLGKRRATRRVIFLAYAPAPAARTWTSGRSVSAIALK